MGYKIFVSYKYKDNSIYPLSNSRSSFPFPFCNTTTVRDYVDKLESYFDHTSNIYKGESDNEDLSSYSDDAIWEACRKTGFDEGNHFAHVSEMVRIGSGAERNFGCGDSAFGRRKASGHSRRSDYSQQIPCQFCKGGRC